MARLSNGGGSTASASHAQAAKDDCLSLNPQGLYNTSDLLANDPGSARVVAINVPGTNTSVAVGTNGSFTLLFGVTSFTYTEQIGNGTLSTAQVHVAAKVGAELVQNWSFEDSGSSGVPPGGFTSSETLPGWTNLNPTVALEDVTAQYGGFLMPITDGTDNFWLDSQGSPGGIDIGQQLQMAAGQAHMEFMVAREPDVLAGGAVYAQDSHEELHFILDGQDVKTLSFADFTKGPGFFQAFDVDTNVASGPHVLEIKSTGASAFVGYAIDSVSVRQMVAVPCMDGTS